MLLGVALEHLPNWDDSLLRRSSVRARSRAESTAHGWKIKLNAKKNQHLEIGSIICPHRDSYDWSADALGIIRCEISQANLNWS